MEKMKRRAFNDVDLVFAILLDYKNEHNHTMVRYTVREINSKIDLLLTMDLITFDEWEFIYDAIHFVQCDMEAA